MSIEEREGVLDLVSDKGILLDCVRLSYSKWFEGDRLTEDALGRKIRVVVDAGEKCTFLKKVLRIGEPIPGWKPSEASKRGSFGGGPGRRFSPEELDLKRDEGIRIARSVAVDRAITMVERGIPIERIAATALAVEEYLLRGTLPKAPPPAAQKEAPSGAAPEPPSSPPSPPGRPSKEERTIPTAAAPRKEAKAGRPPRTQKVSGLAVNALHKEAMRSGIVSDWRDFHDLFRSVLGKEVKTPYNLTIEEFSKVESYVRAKLGESKVA